MGTFGPYGQMFSLLFRQYYKSKTISFIEDSASNWLLLDIFAINATQKI